MTNKKTKSSGADRGRTDEIRAEVERLLECIAQGADHYRVLGVGRDASLEDIRKAYCAAVEQLHPLKCQDLIEAEGVMRWRLSQVYLRVVEAFAALSRPGRRVEYDGVLNHRPLAPIPMPPVPETLQPPEGKTMSQPGVIQKKLHLGSIFGHPFARMPNVGDRRRDKRLALKLPVRVTSGDHKWREVTESVDVSRTGIKLQLTHDAKPGTILLLELPMPLALRSHSHNDQLYVVRAAVRHSADNDSGYLIGAQFQNEPPIGEETLSEEPIDAQSSK